MQLGGTRVQLQVSAERCAVPDTSAPRTCWTRRRN